MRKRIASDNLVSTGEISDLLQKQPGTVDNAVAEVENELETNGDPVGTIETIADIAEEEGVRVETGSIISDVLDEVIGRYVSTRGGTISYESVSDTYDFDDADWASDSADRRIVEFMTEDSVEFDLMWEGELYVEVFDAYDPLRTVETSFKYFHLDSGILDLVVDTVKSSDLNERYDSLVLKADVSWSLYQMHHLSDFLRNQGSRYIEEARYNGIDKAFLKWLDAEGELKDAMMKEMKKHGVQEMGAFNLKRSNTPLENELRSMKARFANYYEVV